jgi:hypothetical protein
METLLKSSVELSKSVKIWGLKQGPAALALSSTSYLSTLGITHHLIKKEISGQQCPRPAPLPLQIMLKHPGLLGSTSHLEEKRKDNNQSIQHGVSEESFVITFSHFVPNQILMPEKRYLSYPNLCKAVGSEPLGQRIRAVQPNIHVFAHSHFAWDMKIEDTRYISAPLCYPRERALRMKSISISSPWQRGSEADGSGCNYRMPWLPLLIYRARFKSDQGTLEGTPQLNHQHHTKICWG